ncbi:glutathione synthetase ATP-binding domain-like protein [Leucogyrophana mollusca]|uniref:Glutathione synthetase ATP-binding domain-like protein n=1 Tax=Leucogyrophana mollusca TaxID=85980 RepID=A0ACB8B241_9AGAM|nr:glutathione synthetase ATP-binding domain-like protein [Leucogyrophana mollusca]
MPMRCGGGSAKRNVGRNVEAKGVGRDHEVGPTDTSSSHAIPGSSTINIAGTKQDLGKGETDDHKYKEVEMPEWAEVTTLKATKAFAQKVSYPVLIHPSYVLSGAAMEVVYDESALEYNLSAAASTSPLHPVHVENAGVHFGDATLVLPPFSLTPQDMSRLGVIAEKVAAAFDISGPYNMQIIKKPAEGPEDEAQIKVIECNLRASQSFPFVSKVLGHNFIDTATAAIVGQGVPSSLTF